MFCEEPFRSLIFGFAAIGLIAAVRMAHRAWNDMRGARKVSAAEPLS
jgi:hypothetical protein